MLLRARARLAAGAAGAVDLAQLFVGKITHFRSPPKRPPPLFETATYSRGYEPLCGMSAIN